MSEETLQWNPDLEVSLFYSMKGHKPVGINRYFHMACIHKKLLSAAGKSEITSKHIWKHLSEMYSLETLNELESLPFPNGENEFCLPEEITNPDIAASQPCSPATSTEDGPVSQRPTNLAVSNLISSALAAESVPSPKRKRRGQFFSSSNPSSPAPGTPGSKRRR
ncbi:MRG/MORF4L-binding protein-like [Rhopilema esculentum]|uniref:MRG/MORF4L-binding protein-like n=1 Tax=Rhopilema esculentum TaxID=499914 RepID=UPI0031D15761|eukprot:gene1332-15730_t